MNIAQRAKEYLENKPTDWVDLSNKLSVRVSTWCNSQINDEVVLLNEEELADDFLSELLSPQVVHLVSGCKSDDEAQDTIIKVISDVFKEKTVDLLEKETHEEEIVDIVDMRSWGNEENAIFTRLSDYENDYGEVEPVASVHIPVNFYIDESELRPIITEILQDQSSHILSPASTIYRLNVIDLALYQAIAQHPELLRTLDWRTFEKLLADILETFGYEVELQRGTKDGGIDLFAIKQVDHFGPQRFLLQAKRWSNKVGVDPVRQLAFLHSHHRITKSCLATTATFTQGAWELAHQYRWQMELRDYEGVQEWVKQAALIKRH